MSIFDNIDAAADREIQAIENDFELGLLTRAERDRQVRQIEREADQAESGFDPYDDPRRWA